MYFQNAASDLLLVTEEKRILLSAVNVRQHILPTDPVVHATRANFVNFMAPWIFHPISLLSHSR